MALRSLVMALVVVGLLTATGCSWFKKGNKNEVAEPTVVAEAPAQPEAVAPAAEPAAEGPRPGSLAPLPELSVIYFDYDESKIRQDQLERIDANLKWLLANADVKVYIEGHCDERGTTEYNFALGNRRAEAVRDYYVQNGIPAERIATVSKGEEEPAVLGKDEAAWGKNRRAEFKRMY
jgi:peptidoglycan-associated lipoprotein